MYTTEISMYMLQAHAMYKYEAMSLHICLYAVYRYSQQNIYIKFDSAACLIFVYIRTITFSRMHWHLLYAVLLGCLLCNRN